MCKGESVSERAEIGYFRRVEKMNQGKIHSAAKYLCGLLLPLIFLLLSPDASAAPPDSTSFNPERAWLVGSAGTLIAGGTLIGLNELWYKDQPRTSFHLFDDLGDWKQMDKAGHAMTAYYMGRMGIRAMQWTGTERKKAIWIGGSYGFAYLTAIEVLDGFSAEWGFSLSDMAANAVGAALVIGQELHWGDQRMQLKFSVHHSPYAQYRPNVLGSNGLERLLKDYNGQTYWLSVNGASWFKEKPQWLPVWLNLAVGYSADGMTGGSSNPAFDGQGNPMPTFDRQRQVYLSFDVDLTRIKTRSKVLKTCFELVSFVKIPAPAIEFNQNGVVRGYWLYF